MKVFIKNIKEESKGRDFIELFLSKLSEMNKIEIKSLLLYYYHDLENRICNNNREEYINYKHGNVNFTKEQLFSPIRDLSNSYRNELLQRIKNNENTFTLVKFLFYIDEVYFKEFLTFFMIAAFDIIKVENMLLNKEIEIFKICLGL